MGNMKLPWREVAAAAAGGLFVWAWRKRVAHPHSFVVPPMEPVSVTAFQPVSLTPGDAPELGTEMPPEMAEMLARMYQMFNAPPAYPEPERDMAIMVHQESNVVEIHVANLFAAEWVRQQGRAFGMLLEPMMPNVPFVLHVNKTISALKVADWLARGWMGNGKQDEGVNDGLTSVDSPG